MLPASASRLAFVTGSTAARRSSLSRAAVVTAAFLLAAAVFAVAVWTRPGQRVDQWLLDVCRALPAVDDLPLPLTIDVVSHPALWIAVAASVVVLVQCRRFSSRTDARRGLASTAALLAFAPATVLVVQFLRDHVLTRPQLHSWIAETANSAPSGHAAAVTAVVVVLVLASPPLLRPYVGTLVGTWAAVLEFVIVAAGWHRPSDVIISTLLVVGAGMLLPDPWRGTVRGQAPRWSLPIPLLITVSAPTVVANFYPTITQVAAAGAIAAVMSMAVLALGVGRTARRANRNPTAEARPTVGATPPTLR